MMSEMEMLRHLTVVIECNGDIVNHAFRKLGDSLGYLRAWPLGVFVAFCAAHCDVLGNLQINQARVHTGLTKRFPENVGSFFLTRFSI